MTPTAQKSQRALRDKKIISKAQETKRIFITLGSAHSINLEIYLKFIQTKTRADTSNLYLVSSESKFFSELECLKESSFFDVVIVQKSTYPSLERQGKLLEVSIYVSSQLYYSFQVIVIEAQKISVADEIYFLLTNKDIKFDPNLDVLLNLPAEKKDFIFNKKKYAGHTEFFRSLSAKNNLLMTFHARAASLALLTDHLPLGRVEQHLKKMLSKENQKNLKKSLLALMQSNHHWKKKITIVILGLNPHASEEGMLGNFDTSIYMERLKKLLQESAKKLSVELTLIGPVGADSSKHYFTDNYLIISFYHDQGLSIFKTLFGFNAIHQTVGFEWKNEVVKRFSLDHGTGKQIAYQNKGSDRSLQFCWKFINT